MPATCRIAARTRLLGALLTAMLSICLYAAPTRAQTVHRISFIGAILEPACDVSILEKTRTVGQLNMACNSTQGVELSIGEMAASNNNIFDMASSTIAANTSMRHDDKILQTGKKLSLAIAGRQTRLIDINLAADAKGMTHPSPAGVRVLSVNYQ